MSAFKQPEYLYYGSSQRVDIITPNRGHKEGRQNGIYATPIRDIALAFALGIVPDEAGNQDRVLDYKFDSGQTVMIFHKGHPNFGGKGYVYKLPAKGFEYAGGTQWVSYSPVKPVEITEINVNDYLYLFRYATEEEKRQIEENFSER